MGGLLKDGRLIGDGWLTGGWWVAYREGVGTYGDGKFIGVANREMGDLWVSNKGMGG
jgi:hypothetical protein